MPEQQLRPTRQRTAVTQALAEVDDFRSAREIHDLLREQGHAIGLATVYRTLQLLADHDQVDVIRSVEGEASYRQCAADHHHHHLVCRSCGATVEVDGPAVERWAGAIAEEHGFADVSHTLEVFGVCPGCRGEDAR